MDYTERLCQNQNNENGNWGDGPVNAGLAKQA